MSLSSPHAGESSRSLPEQVFSSPTDHKRYPAATLAAVEATRARFFARDSSARRPPRRPITAHPLSAGSYRQSFYERCQQAMDQTRAEERTQRVTAFRKGQSEFTKGFFSDDAMDVEDEPSSPPPSSQDEDDELVRHKIIAEYSRLKRIYELKGQLEIGWMHPDHVAWLEDEIRQHDGAPIDPLLNAADDELEQLWQQSRDQLTLDDDAAFEQALANLPI